MKGARGLVRPQALRGSLHLVERPRAAAIPALAPRGCPPCTPYIGGLGRLDETPRDRRRMHARIAVRRTMVTFVT